MVAAHTPVCPVPAVADLCIVRSQRSYRSRCCTGLRTDVGLDLQPEYGGGHGVANHCCAVFEATTVCLGIREVALTGRQKTLGTYYRDRVS